MGVLQALLVAVALSIVDVVRRSATPHDAVLGWVERLGRYADVRLHPRARVTPGVLVYRLDDRLFFANAGYVKGRVREALHGAPTPVRWLVFDAEALTHVDATGMDALTSLVRSLRQDEITLVFARLKDPMRQTLREAGVLDLVGEAHDYPTVRAAVQATGLMHMLLVSTPRPGQFFTWIMALVTLIAMVLPFLTDAEPSTKLATAALNLSIGATIGSLVSSIARSAVRVVNA